MLWVLWVCTYPSQTLAAAFDPENLNLHEHFSTVAAYEDYDRAFRKYGPTMGQIGDLKLGEITAHPHQIIGSLFGERALSAFNAGSIPLENWTLDQVAARLGLLFGGDLPLYLKSFFEFTSVNQHSKQALEWIGWEIRTRIQKILIQMHPHALSSLFESYLSLHRGGSMSLSINAKSFIEPHSRSALDHLSEFAQERFDFKFEYFIVLQRSRLLSWSDSEFSRFLGELGAVVHDKWLYGVDLVGSLHESDLAEIRFDRLSRERFRIRFAQLMESVSRHRLQFRLHAWEAPGGVEGDFYDEFWRYLERVPSAKMPRIFRVGHISALRTQDLQRFVRARQRLGVHFIFEANIDSNVRLHGRKEATLFETIRALDSASFPLVFGTDGIGIWGAQSAIPAVLARIKESNLLSSFAVRRIRNDMIALAQLQKGALDLKLDHRPALSRPSLGCSRLLFPEEE